MPGAPTTLVTRPDGVAVLRLTGRLDLAGAERAAAALEARTPDLLLLDVSHLDSYEPDAIRALSAALDGCTLGKPRFACVALVPDATAVRMAMRVVAMTLGGAFRQDAAFELAYTAPVAELILTKIVQDNLRATTPGRRRASSTSLAAQKPSPPGGTPKPDGSG